MRVRENTYATKAPKWKQGQARSFALCGAIVMLLTAIAPANSAEPFNFPPSDFHILNADTGKLIGNGHYSVDHAGGGFVLHGEDHYFSGEHDIEEAQLSATDAHAMPALVRFHHDFYNAAGTLVVAGRLDIETGLGICGRVVNGVMELKSAELKFPSDTYAGASVLLPIQDYVRRGNTALKLDLHVFNCAPSPKLIAVLAKSEPLAQNWQHYPGQLDKIDIKPNLGLFTVLVTPFIPKLAAWFDPSHDSLLVGAELERYYKGARIILVRADVTGDNNRSPAAAISPSPLH